MKLVFDENIPPRIAEALSVLGVEAVAVARTPVHRKDDLSVIKWTAAEGACFVSRDRRILKNPSAHAALKANRLVAFFLKDGEASAADIARVIFSCLPEMIECAKTNPGGYHGLLKGARGSVQRLWRGDP